jgi:dihydroneopterin aldolase
VRCFEVVREVVERAQHRLLEAVAERIADALLREPRAERVRVRVAKQPPIPGVISRVAVLVERARRAGAT